MEPKLLTAVRFVDSTCGISYRYVYSDTEYFRPHFHDYYEVFLLLEGAVTHHVNGHAVPLGRGSLVFIRPNDTHDYLLRAGERFSMLNMTATRDTVEGLLDYLAEGFPAAELLSAALPPTVLLEESDFQYILTQMTAIRAIGEDETARRKTALRILLFRIFTRFFAGFREQTEERGPLWLERLAAEMRRDGNFIQGIPRMVALSGKSREHLARSVKRHLGMTLSGFINELRLNFIANMLKNSNHSITDIVYESGFGNFSWAAELFFQRYGVTMSAYRKKG
ncbi:MAG: helix-turn-helix domain-containing protein [Clostridia bacterium]|nr:helix-turn-helix domain-containing protein [Clostridia bacterium]